MFARPPQLREALDPVAAGQPEEPAEHLQDRRRDVGVVPIQAEARVGVVETRVQGQRLLQRLLDPLAVAGGGQELEALAVVLDAHAVRRAQVEPRLGAPGLARDPLLAGGNDAR